MIPPRHWIPVAARALAFTGLLGALPLARPQGATPPQVRALDLGAGDSLEVRLVRAGAFTQGSPPAETGRGDDETTRPVTLTGDFYLGTSEVTVGQFRKFADATGYKTEAEKGASGGFGWDGTGLSQRKEFTWRNPGFPQTDQHPVVVVTHEDAEKFCTWLGTKNQTTVRLPTEAQWEFAARAAGSSPWPGSDRPAAVAWTQETADHHTHPVRQLTANALGFFDLGGNAAEWCADWYGSYATGEQTDPSVVRPPGTDQPRRVLRGGSWLRAAKHARVAARYRNDPRSRNADNGFRVLALPNAKGASAKPAGTSPTTSAPTPAAAAAPINPPRDANSVPTSVSAPPASPTPRPIPAPSSGFPGISVLFWLLAPLAGFIGFTMWIAQRVGGRKSAPGYSSADSASPANSTSSWQPARVIPPANVQLSVGDDGFRWLLHNVAAGELIRYSAVVAGQSITDTLAYEPAADGQFVYTGSRPEQVKILGVASGSEGLVPRRTTAYEAGPGAHETAGPWINQGGGYSSPSTFPSPPPIPRPSSSRRYGAYE